MNDLKDDSVFVLRVMLILGGFFMFCFSKTGTYLCFLLGATLAIYFTHSIHRTPLLNQLTYSTIFISIAFELIYPVLFRRNKTTFLDIKKDFMDAKEELGRRKNIINPDNEE